MCTVCYVIRAVLLTVSSAPFEVVISDLVQRENDETGNLLWCI